jgi:uncharacterized protein (DUF697 family)/predicted GTPase
VTTERKDDDMRPGVARALEQVEALLDALPSKKAKEAKNKLKEVREMLLDQRPPRLVLVGRRGSGKSSLINALFSEYVAPVGHEKAQTGSPSWFRYEGTRGTLELLDTRGFQEAHLPSEHDAASTPLDSILTELEKRCPDAVLFLVKASEAGSATAGDLDQLKALSERLKSSHGVRVPLMAVVTHCDLIEPKGVRLDRPEGEDEADYQEKLARAKRIERIVSDQLRAVNVLREGFITTVGVSCYQSWRGDGSRRADERWNIAALVEFLYEKLPRQARLELVRLAQVKALQRKLARTLTGVAASACAAVAATPIPVGDLLPITSLQVSLVAAIGYISGRTMTTRTAAEFLTAMGANVGVGFAMREAARAMVKLIPVAGSVVSAAVAAAGTVAIGEGAAAYFIDGISIEGARLVLKKNGKVAALEGKAPLPELPAAPPATPETGDEEAAKNTPATK